LISLGIPPNQHSFYWYRVRERYPEGVADVVGDWAESKILGGVVLSNINIVKFRCSSVSATQYVMGLCLILHLM
jgi:hypothetical protein